MPVIKNKLRRYSIIIDVLNRLEPISKKNLLVIVKYRLGQEICMSTLDKDLADLKVDFDIELKFNRKGIWMTGNVDFQQRLTEWLRL